MALTRYGEKRDFSKTPEPKPDTFRRTLKENQRVFVVQEHHASHLHYDFRLEMGGVLKSWAVPKGPPRTIGVKRLAVLTEDHPFAYKDFEGVIPKGNYGAGTVSIWDQGLYQIDKGHMREGHFSFIMYGKKLQGRYALAHLEGKNWILTKARL